MRNVLKYCLITTFLALSIIHFYWSAGGSIGYSSSLPADENGNILLAPTTVDCILVGVFLLLFAIVYTQNPSNSNSKILKYFIKFGQWIIPIIFLIRAIGEFKYVGFFKEVTTTEFAQMNPLRFSLLCLTIGCVGIFIALKKTKAILKQPIFIRVRLALLGLFLHFYFWHTSNLFSTKVSFLPYQKLKN